MDHQLKDLPRIWVRKKITLIFAMDGDKDGINTYEDMMAIADRIIKSANLRGAASDNVVQFFRDTLTKLEDEKHDITIKTWDKCILDLWSAEGSPKIMEGFGIFYTKLFQALDFNYDGFIHFSEYIHWWNALGLDPSLARLQFDYMDTDHDERITEKEFVDTALDYEFNHTDTNTKNRFYGPLIDF